MLKTSNHQLALQLHKINFIPTENALINKTRAIFQWTRHPKIGNHISWAKRNIILIQQQHNRNSIQENTHVRVHTSTKKTKIKRK